MTSNNLVPVFTGQMQDHLIQLCNARDLHATLESGQDFSDWIKNRIEKYGFIDGEDYSINLWNRSDGRAGKPRTDYHLTIDMAKELAMVENNDKGRQVRRYFIALEKKAKAQAARTPIDRRLTTEISRAVRQALLENNSALLPPAQADEIKTRLDRLASMFHPLSPQFCDVLGVIRLLRGRDPRIGHVKTDYKQVIESA